jgi:hypothetical protein
VLNRQQNSVPEATTQLQLTMTRNANRRRISQLFANLKKRQRGNDNGSCSSGSGSHSSSGGSEEYDALSMNERGSQSQSLDWIPEAPPDDEDEDDEQYQQQHNRHEKQQRYGSLRTSTNASLDSNTNMDSLPLPAALRPLVKRLAASDAVTDEEMVAVLFIVRLTDALHRVAYATFLTVSFVDELRKKLHVPDLDMEIEVNAIRWSYQQG